MPRQLGGKPCQRCGEPKPPGRARYCGDGCAGAAFQERQAARAKTRMAKCQGCGGDKEPGVRGGRFCAECRRLQADTTGQLEYERNRRKVQAERAAKIASEKGLRRHNDPPDGHKWCARCQEFRPLTSFPKRDKAGKPAAYCRPCQRSYNRERSLQRSFGLTWDEYELMLACQEDRCYLCRRLPRKTALAVDHNHKTGEIRGLLCRVCNHRMLGAAKEDPALLRKAADYLEDPPAKEVFGVRKYVPGFSEDGIQHDTD